MIKKLTITMGILMMLTSCSRTEVAGSQLSSYNIWVDDCVYTISEQQKNSFESWAMSKEELPHKIILNKTDKIFIFRENLGVVRIKGR